MNFNGLQNKIKPFAAESTEVAEGIKEATNAVLLFSATAASGNVPLTLAGAIAAMAEGAAGVSRILKEISFSKSDVQLESKSLESISDVETVFHLLVQQSFLGALVEYLGRMDLREDLIWPSEFFDIDDDPVLGETAFDRGFSVLEGNIPLFNCYERRVLSILRSLELPIKNFGKEAKRVVADAQKKLSFHVSQHEATRNYLEVRSIQGLSAKMDDVVRKVETLSEKPHSEKNPSSRGEGFVDFEPTETQNFSDKEKLHQIQNILGPRIQTVSPSVDLEAKIRNQFEDARASIHGGDWGTAQIQFQSLVELTGEDSSPEMSELNARCHANLGLTHYHFGNNDKAVECFDHAFLLYPNLPRFRFNKGLSCIIKKDFEQAKAILLKLHEDSPEEPNVIQACCQVIETTKGRQAALDFLDQNRVETIEWYSSFISLLIADRNYEAASKLLNSAGATFGQQDESLKELKGRLLAFPILVSDECDPILRRCLSTAELAKIRSAAELTQSSVDIMVKEGNTRGNSVIFLNLSSYYDVLGEHELSKVALEKSLELSPNDVGALKNKFGCLLPINPNEAISVAEKLLGLEDAPQNFDRLLRAYFVAEKYNQVVQHFETLNSEKAKNFECGVVYASALLKRGERDKAINFIEELQKDFPQTMLGVLALCHFYESVRDYERCFELLEEAATKFDQKFGNIFHSEIGRILCENEKWEEAYQRFQKLNGDEVDRLHPVAQIRAAFETDRMEECLKKAEHFAKDHGFDSTIWQILTISYFTIGEPKKSLSYAKELREKSQNPHSGFLLAQVLLRLGEIDMSRQLLETIHDENPVDVIVLSKLSGICAALGFAEKAVVYAREAYSIDSESIEAIKAASSLMFIEGTEQYLTKENSSFIRDALEKDPDVKAIPTGQKDNKFEPLLKFLKESEEHSNDAHKHYLREKWPIEMGAKLRGQNVWQFWMHNIFANDGKVFMAFGTTEEQSLESDTAFSASEVVVDISGLLTLSLLDLFDEFQKCFNRIIVPTPVFEFFKGVESNQELIKKSALHVGVRDEWEKEKHQSILAFFDIERVEVKGLEPAMWEKLKNEDPKISAMGVFDSMFVALGASVPMYSDQMKFSGLFRGEYKGSAFSTQAVLRLMLQKGTISQNQYEAALFTLIQHNYEFVSFSSRTLETALTWDDGCSNIKLKSFVSDFFKGASTSLGNIRVAGEGMAKIWINGKIDNETKKEFLEQVALDIFLNQQNDEFIVEFFGGVLMCMWRLPKNFFGFILALRAVLGTQSQEAQFICSMAIRFGRLFRKAEKKAFFGQIGFGQSWSKETRSFAEIILFLTT